MTWKSRHILASTLLILLMTCATAQAQQPDPDAPASQAAQEKLNAWKQRLASSLQAEQSVLRQLFTVESEQRRQQDELNKINHTLSQVRARAAEAQQQIDQLRSEQKRRAARLKITLRRLYRLGRGGMWQILLESPDLRTFLIRYKALVRFLKKDVEVVTGFQNQLDRLALTRSDLAEDIRALATLKADAETRRDAVWLERQKRQALLDAIQRNKALALRVTRELENRDARITDAIRALPDLHPAPTVDPTSLVLDFTARKGYLKLPVRGVIAGRFGPQTSRRFGTITKSNGIEIAAQINSPVRVVADGTVRYVGDFLGYGRVLIVDHGDRYHSLYAHLDRFLVNKGDAVKAGTAIGTVGVTGAMNESILHFEIRHKGVAQDPLAWLDRGGSKEEP